MSAERKFVKVVESSWAQFVEVEFARDHEHRRSDCPDFQYWYLRSGDWRVDRPGLRTDPFVSSGYVAFQPFEKCHRIVRSQSFGAGLRVFRNSETEKLRLGFSHLWRISHLAQLGILDSLTLDCLVREVPVARKLSPPAWLARVYDLIHDDPTLNWGVHEFAEFAAISPSQLIHEFKAHYGERIFEMRNRLRVERMVLCGGSAVDLGFYDQSHLNRASKKHLGVSAKSAVLYKTLK